tara:strand:+ start:2094 stop:3962 length:1869 start_codon:yes stop_codon:yes gene_type:complete
MTELSKNPKVTMFKTVYDTSNPFMVDLSVALDRIKSGTQEKIITEIRGSEDGKKKKSELPVVIFSGQFNSRRDVDLVEYSGLMVCDFDKVDVDKTKTKLSGDDYVLACWTSPSGNGVKALVEVHEENRHVEHFNALTEYFSEKHDLVLDPTGKNMSRACYESFDPDIIIKGSSKVYVDFKKEERVEIVEVPETVGKSQINYAKLQVAAGMIRSSADGEKHSTLLRAARLMGGYVASGILDKDDVVHVLETEIEARGVDDMGAAKRTIQDALREGMLVPITDVDRDFYDERRKIELADNDNTDYLSNDDEDLAEIMRIKRGEMELGLKTGHPEIDKYFRYKRGAFVVMNGHSSVGKTTLVLHFMINAAIRLDWKWFVYSSESRTATIKTRLIEYASQQLLSDLSEHQIVHYYGWVNEHFSFLSNKRSYSYTDILLYSEKEMRRRSFDALFVDPYNSLSMDNNGSAGFNAHQYNYEAATAMLTFCQQSGISLWLNTHANTAAQRKKGQDGHSVAPYAEDSEGGSLFLNRCDMFLTFHRKVQHEDEYVRRTMELHVRKMREQESGGRPTASDSPIRFEMSPDSTSFWVNGSKKFFPSVNESLTEEQVQVPLYEEPKPDENTEEVF